MLCVLHAAVPASNDHGTAAGAVWEASHVLTPGGDLSRLAVNVAPHADAFQRLATAVPAVLICVCQIAYTVLVFVLPDRVDYFDTVRPRACVCRAPACCAQSSLVAGGGAGQC